MTKQGGADEVVVDRGNCLARIDIAELHERRLVLRFDDDRLAQVGLAMGQHLRSWPEGVIVPSERVRLFRFSCGNNLQECFPCRNWEQWVDVPPAESR